MLKSDGTTDRDEYETILTEDDYYKFSKIPYIGSIIKLRYNFLIPNTNLVIGVDNYIGNLYGLLTAEIEFNREEYSENKIEEFAKKYLGNDIINVTTNNKYKDRNLAILDNIVHDKMIK